ncbi:MAG: septum formation initiator family protein [Bacteroidales bacterium]
MKKSFGTIPGKIAGPILSFYRGTQILRLVAAIFVVFMVFFDENSILKNIQYRFKIRELTKEINYYKGVIDESKGKLNELNSSPENLEKFAREQFLMKKANEDIYLVKPRN